MSFHEDEIAYIVANGFRVLPVRVVRTTGDLYTLALKSGKCIRLPEGRLYATEAEAERIVQRIVVKEEQPAPSDPHEWERRYWEQ